MPVARTVSRSIKDICGERNVLTAADELLVYERDAYPLARARPQMVIFPTSTANAAEVVSLLHAHRIPFVPRGSGTSLAGGCLAGTDTVCISTARMRKILEIDYDNRCAAVEAGVITQDISNAVQQEGFIYEPDPSSQTTCTIGGNVANNAGGPHSLKYGVTNQHILGITVVLPDGEILKLGGKCAGTPGYDLKGLFVGSEGTLGLITEVMVRLHRAPPAYRTVFAVYDTMEDAGTAVGEILAAGILPAAMEIMDQAIIRIVEDAYGYGLPRDAGAILIIEIDGIEAGLEAQLQRILAICREHRAQGLEYASRSEDRELLWKARKTAFGALGRLAPNCIVQDGVVPRSKLPRILRFIERVARDHNVQVANNFHAGDGNIHPNFLFDARNEDQVQRVLQASEVILAECVRLGGSITGEHGIGVEKIHMLKLMYSQEDLLAQEQVRQIFDPDFLANPNKVFCTNGSTEPKEALLR